MANKFPFDDGSNKMENIFKLILKNKIKFDNKVKPSDQRLILGLLQTEPSKRTKLIDLKKQLNQLIVR